MPWLRTTSEPPPETVVLLAVPPDDTISEPPLSTVVPTAVPPDKISRVPPLSTSTPPLVWPEEMVKVQPFATETRLASVMSGQADRDTDHRHRDDDLHRTDPLGCQRQLRQTGSGARSRPWPLFPRLDRAKSLLSLLWRHLPTGACCNCCHNPQWRSGASVPAARAREDRAPVALAPQPARAGSPPQPAGPSGNRPIP
jgi:hypothetical protein